MNYLRSAFSDFRLKYHVTRIVGEIVMRRGQDSERLAEAVRLADQYADLVLSTIRTHLSYARPESAYGALLLLESLVASCNYSFHVALAHCTVLQDRVVLLAIRRTVDNAHRRVQRLARLTLLEYSRIFADDPKLAPLAQLLRLFEQKTGKSLMRCLNMQHRRVKFRDPGPSDVIAITHEDDSSSDSVTRREPIRLSAVEVWPCHACGYLNAPAACRCAACETVRFTHAPADSASTSKGPTPRHSTTTTTTSTAIKTTNTSADTNDKPALPTVNPARECCVEDVRNHAAASEEACRLTRRIDFSDEDLTNANVTSPVAPSTHTQDA